MSWDATLVDDRCHVVGDWNYTHNTNGMANVALDVTGFVRPRGPHGNGASWFQCLDGLDGPAGASLLHRIIGEMRANPPVYRVMNPANGWGDYDTFLETLSGMRDAVPEWPTEWSAHG